MSHESSGRNAILEVVNRGRQQSEIEDLEMDGKFRRHVSLNQEGSTISAIANLVGFLPAYASCYCTVLVGSYDMRGRSPWKMSYNLSNFRTLHLPYKTEHWLRFVGRHLRPASLVSEKL